VFRFAQTILHDPYRIKWRTPPDEQAPPSQCRPVSAAQLVQQSQCNRAFPPAYTCIVHEADVNPDSLCKQPCNRRHTVALHLFNHPIKDDRVISTNRGCPPNMAAAGPKVKPLMPDWTLPQFNPIMGNTLWGSRAEF